EDGGVLAPLATLALGARDQTADERRLGRLLASEDPVLRSHAAFALAASPVPDAATRLANAWRFEPEAVVRRAILRALAQRKEPQRMATLALAAKLDPDSGSRELGRLGVLGLAPAPLGRLGAGCGGDVSPVGSCYVACIALVRSGADPSGSPLDRAGTLLDASGLALPVVTDPDGVVIVAGVSPGKASFRLASSAFWDDADAHDAAKTEPAR
ncbi:MAG TPA: HEAT repeat domain-containing protein, partial [Polyangiaceae bacterium]|nr:HEAT repeat domain-containing protein [Polyangiaceae bacterium]